MLDEEFIGAIFLLLTRIKCKLGLHEWDRIDNEFVYNKYKEIINEEAYDTRCVEIYQCEDCLMEKVLWEDFWGVWHTLKFKK